jgi:MoaA/NifB/PqqE/SkfB family radical SAM enzyme
MNEGVGKETYYAGVNEGCLSIEVTTHCNAACLHCFARAGKSGPSNLSVDLVKKIIAEGYDTGYRHLHITGGEPLLWEGLWEALCSAFDKGYATVFLNTNGMLITERMSGRLAEYRGLLISVSLEGTEAFHDHLRGGGSHRRASQGIEKALSAGVGLQVFALATRSLLPVLPCFADETYSKFPTIRCLTLIPLVRVQDNIGSLRRELFAPEHFLRLVRTVSLLNLYGLRTDVLNDPLINVASKLLEIPWIPKASALNHQGNMIVMANRNIRSSHSSRGSFGKYAPGMIKEVLASDAYRKAVAPDEATCPSCKYIEMCRGNGLLRPSDYEWDTHGGVPYCRRVLDRAVS